jgi:hypothetical protein
MLKWTKVVTGQGQEHMIRNVRQTTSGVYAITVTTSTYHGRRCGRLQVNVIWRRQEKNGGGVNTGVRYLSVCFDNRNISRQIVFLS